MLLKFCGKAQFSHSFGRINQNYVETAFPQDFYTRKLGEITVFTQCRGNDSVQTNLKDNDDVIIARSCDFGRTLFFSFRKGYNNNALATGWAADSNYVLANFNDTQLHHEIAVVLFSCQIPFSLLCRSNTLFLMNNQFHFSR